MLFNSLNFIYFLPVVVAIYHLLPQKFRLYFLLLSSYYFYMSWKPIYLVLILASTLVDYSAGLALGKTEKLPVRRLILSTSLIFNLGLLCYFKYANFFLENLSHITEAAFEPLSIILPVGISFYTFQTMSYTIDVYNRKVIPEKNLGVFALYVSFFPQLVAGPIERFSKLRAQFKELKPLSEFNISSAAKFILYGFFMKMVIADNIGVVVDSGYTEIEELHSVSLVLLSFLYSVQIYCDFHGYSTIAIGVALLFGVKLSKNFNSPYFSHSITDYWRNWHITLSTWFRDYIYYPLGGNRGTLLKWAFAILAVFIVSGIWHGANWTFVIWGAAHALVIILEKLFKLDSEPKNQVLKALQGLVTFSVVSILFVFFRSPSVYFALQYFSAITQNWSGELLAVPLELICYIAGFALLDRWTRNTDIVKKIQPLALPLRWSFYFVVLFLILSRSGADVKPFIYFQF